MLKLRELLGRLVVSHILEVLVTRGLVLLIGLEVIGLGLRGRFQLGRIFGFLRGSLWLSLGLLDLLCRLLCFALEVLFYKQSSVFKIPAYDPFSIIVMGAGTLLAAKLALSF